MGRIRVKICGITRPEDALKAADAGADAIGLVFYSASPRAVDISTAQAITRVLPPFITRVGLFVDAPQEYISSILGRVNLDMLQFHGGEKQEDCSAYALPYIKAVKVSTGAGLKEQIDLYNNAAGILLDTYIAGKAGGTGQVFDWSVVPQEPGKPVILAGGLDAGNVLRAIRQVRPYAVDVSGGVESAPGIKDGDKIACFIEQVRKYADE